MIRLLPWLARFFASPAFWLTRYEDRQPRPSQSFAALRQYWRRIFHRNTKRPWGHRIFPLWRA